MGLSRTLQESRHSGICALLTTTGVRYDVEMDVLVADAEDRRGCLHQPGVMHDCRTLTSGVITFPDDVIEHSRAPEARWVAVFPVGGAYSSVKERSQVK